MTADPSAITDHHGNPILPQHEPSRILLQDSEDDIFLSPILCLVRSQIEIFVATLEDVSARSKTGGNRHPITVGQVGIRCVHCADQPHADRSKGSMAYPTSIRLVHQAVRNWQRHHMLSCPFVPAAVKETYLGFKAGICKSTQVSTQYWIDSCRRKGLVDGDEDNRIWLVGSDHSAKQVSLNPMASSTRLPSAPSPNEKKEGDFKASASDSSAAAPCSGELPQSSESVFPLPTLSNGMVHEANVAVTAGKYALMTEKVREIAGDEKKDEFPKPNDTDTQKKFLLSYNINQSSVAPNEILLEKVKLALETVKTSREIRCLRPASDEGVSDSKNAERRGYAGTKFELRTIGVELYELFAGYSPLCVNDNGGVLDMNEQKLSRLTITQASMKKRETRVENKHFASLRDKALPVSLCNVVSSLLDENTAAIQYDSVGDLEEDLRALIKQPGLFLFHENAGTGIGLDFPANKLFDRDGHIATLLESYDRVAASNSPCEMVLLRGHSGVGKSSLVLEAKSLIRSRGGSFALGKFDELRRGQPLAALVSAFNEHCDNLSRKNTEYLRVTRAAILDALGSDARVVTDLVPNLCKIIGEPKQAATPLGGKEAHFRLMYLLRMFLSVSTGPRNPTVFVLDDLQWGDETSMELFRFLATDPQTKSVLFVGCYRENEVCSDHAVVKHLLNIDSSGVALTTIDVGNMSKRSVNLLISETLHVLPRLTLPLTDVVYQNTMGNALFVVQFLSSLFDEGLLRFSLSAQCWVWDIDLIWAKDVAENVADLMTRTMLKLPSRAQTALKIAACLGTRFPTLILRLLDHEDANSVGIVRLLDEFAVGKGLMCNVGPVYKFSHDQIRCAAYNLVPACNRDVLHYEIGRTLWKLASTEELECIIFEVVDQLHRGQSLLVERDEKIEFARLILKAGEKAVSSYAFMSALSYLTIGKDLLADSDWDHHYELCLNMFNACAEAEYILGQTSGGTILRLKEVISRARSSQDQLRATITLIRYLSTMGNLKGALELGLECLERLGEPIPSVFDDDTCQAGLADTEKMLRDTTEEGILNLREMSDTDPKKKVMKLLSLLFPISAMIFSSLQHFIAFRMVCLSLSHGVCSDSSVAFSCYGFYLCGTMGDYARGYRFGKLALALLDRFQDAKCSSQVHANVYGNTTGWTEPLQVCLQPLLEGHHIGLSTGSIYHSFLCALLYGNISLYSGASLEQLSAEIASFQKQAVEYKQHTWYMLMKPLHQAILNLSTSSAEDPTKLDLGDLDQGIAPAVKITVYSYQMWIAYLFNEYETAAAFATKRRGIEGQEGGNRMYAFSFFTFNEGLTALALAREGRGNQWKHIAEDSMKKMQTWAQTSQWNFQHKLELLKAEYWFLTRDTKAAAMAYEESIALAGTHRYINEQALAYERAGIFYLESGNRKQATDCFTQCHQLYSQWGAHRKADDVLERLEII